MRAFARTEGESAPWPVMQVVNAAIDRPVAAGFDVLLCVITSTRAVPATIKGSSVPNTSFGVETAFGGFGGGVGNQLVSPCVLTF